MKFNKYKPITLLVSVLMLLSTLIATFPLKTFADTFFSDTFTNTDGTDLSSHNAGWTTGSNMQIESNMAKCTANSCDFKWQNDGIVDGCISADVNYPTGSYFAQFDKRNDHRVLGFFNNRADNTLHITGYNFDNSNVYYFSGDTYDPSSLTGLHTWKLCSNDTNATLFLDGALLSSATIPSDYVFFGYPHFGIYQNDIIDNFLLEGTATTSTPTPTNTPTPTPAPVQTYTVTGNVYIDANQNGIKDVSEINYQGTTVRIQGTSFQTTTDTNGNYSFTNVPAGNYYIMLVTPSGYIGTTNGYENINLNTATTLNFGIIQDPNPYSNIFSDTFTDADGTDLSSHNAGWTTGSNMQIDNNMTKCTGSYCDTKWQNNEIIDGCMSADINYPTGSYFAQFDKRNDHRVLGFFNNRADNTLHITGYDFDYSNVYYFSGDIFDPSSLTGLHTWKLCSKSTSATLYLDGTLVSNATIPPDYVFSGSPHFGIYQNDIIDNFAITVPVNQTPQINSISGGTINEGAAYSENGSFNDSGSSSWTATVDYGDGSGTQSLLLNGTNFSLSHVYKDNGTYTVTVNVTDNQDTTGTETTTVTVNNVVPTVGTITAPSMQQINTLFTASASFTEPGVLDTHNSSQTFWNWGDGNTTTATVTENNGSGSVSDTHSYSTSGVYTIKLTITDKDGGVSTSTFQYVSAYNVVSAFKGGNSFDNSSGSYPNTSGKVKFGIQTSYNNNNILTGNVKMNLKNPNIDFVSTNLISLVTMNGKAYLYGRGTVNGSGTYDFLATGIDHTVAGGTNDLIRFQIKDHSTGIVVYDSQFGASDTTDPTTVVSSGGGIKVQ